tara:strand:+ start:31 stop:3108 length:3078 start_codon:yes stop_codon:yes gene_type:complete
MPVVDLRFVVHDREDIELATKSLVAFNKISLKRQDNYDAEAAAAKRGMTATTKLLSLDRKLTTQRKIEKQMVEEGLMSKKEQIALSERYDRILEQETRTLQNYIDTDRVLVKEQKEAAKSEEALGKQRTKTKNETEKLRRTYDSTYGATQKYKQGLKDIDRAFEGMEDGPERASRAIKALKSDYQAFIAASKSGGIVDAGNQFARYGDQAYRAQQRTKRFASVGLQQAGYQVNDFIVQIASGQNALVAFGQQGSQLAGIFGTKGAVVGALIAGVAALGNLAYQAYMAQEGIKTLEDALTDLEAALSMVSEAEQVIENIGSGDYFGHMANEVDLLAESLRALGLTMGLVELKAGMKAVTDVDMGLMDEFIAGTVKQTKELTLALIPFQYLFIKKKSLEEEMLDSQAKGMATDLFGPDSSKVGYTEAFLQDLEKLQKEPVINAEKIAERVTRFTTQADIWGFDKATEDGRKLFDQLIKLAQGAAKLAEVQADSVRLEQARRAVVLESANEFEALYKLMDKEDKEYWKSYFKAYKLQQKQQADRLKAGIADAKKIAAAQEKAAEGGAKVQLKYQNAVLAASAKLANAEGKRASAQTQEEALAAKMAGEQVKAQYESLRLKNGQLQLTAKQTAEMDKQIRLAKAAATQAVVLKYEAKTAAERIAEGARAARELATQIERASKAYETFLNKTNNINDNTAGIRKQIEILRKGGSTQDAAAEGRNETAMRKVQREADELRAQQKALGPDRTLTDVEITASQLAQEKALGRNLAATRLKNKELDKRKGKGGKTPKGEKDPLVELQNRLNLQTDLLGMTEAQGQVYKALGDKYSEVDREVIKSLESQIEYNKMVEFGTNQLADGLMSIVDGTKSVKDAFKDMARELVAQLYKVYVMERMVASIGGYIGGMGSVGSVHANGNVFNSGSLVPYANGGIVAGPTTFPMSGGKTGLMGEAGPEAIMPLKRGANGKLGVQAEGGSGDVIIHQNFNFTANGDESVKKIIAQQAPAIANMTKKQILDDRRRGGQMKQAFG